MKTRIAQVAAVAIAAVTSLHAQGARIAPATLARVGQVDPRYISYNVEMVEVTGGRFWAPYKAEKAASAAADTQASPSVPGLGADAFRVRTPIDLSSPKLRALAAALGPAYVRVSGTWANSTYFHDSDAPAPAAPPAGFGGVLTRAQWKGVVDFARAANAQVVTSFAISPGVRDEAGTWTPAQAQALLAYTASVGGRIAAAEFFNEPNVAAMGGAPRGYDAAAYGRDFKIFAPFARKAAPGILLVGPGSVGEGALLAAAPGAAAAAPAAFLRGAIKSEDMLAATGPGLDALSFHHYGSVSKRCAGMGGPMGQTTPEAALSADWLSRTERDAAFYGALRDRFEPGKPLWLTETGETACGGNPWASTFIDTFRYTEQLGRLAKMGVHVVMHNTLSASDYALIDEDTLDPRPNYWIALLWKRLMGTVVLDAGPSPAPGVDLFAHCLAGTPGGVALVAVNTEREAAREMSIDTKWDRYTLTSPGGLLSHEVHLSGTPLALGRDGRVPVLRGESPEGGRLSLPPASITFLAVPGAKNPACR